jgi:4-amino-4-deoxy-L-arabinose transferase-like glycosyltransferase
VALVAPSPAPVAGTPARLGRPAEARGARTDRHSWPPRAALPWLALGALVLAGLLWRTRDYMLLPRLTDETGEVLLGLRIARGEALPAVNVQPYIGALYNYLVAGAFLALGPRIDAGRLVAAVAGALTLVPTYLLGRALGGPGARGQLVGLLGAGLLAASATHALVSSRIAYSNSLTPLFATTALWLLHRALARQSGPSLVLAALLFGLAVQTHLSALALAPGLALAVLLSGRGLLLAGAGRPSMPGRARWLPSRWAWLALLASVVAIANIVGYNVTHPLASASGVELRSGRYLGEEVWTVGGWLDRLLRLLRAVALALGGAVSEDVQPWALSSPMVVAVVGLALLGLASFARRGAWLPLLATVSVLLVVSSMNGRVEPVVPRARHYAPLLPLGLVAAAEGLMVLRTLALGALARLRAPRRLGRGVADAVLALAVVGLIAGSVASLRAYEAERLARPEKHNGALLAVLAAIEASGARDERVYVDAGLAQALTMSGGRTLTHLRYAFLVTGQEYDTLDVRQQPLPLGRAATSSRRLVLRGEDVPAVEGLYRLDPLPGEPGPGAPLRAFRAYAR